MTPSPNYIMIGGFLGAGKSTSVIRLAGYLRDRGRRVGLITNDQGAGLVDTELVRWSGFAVEEIADGCFCCRFDSLIEAANNLSRETMPDVFIAEPVGSCTDLVSAVTVPLKNIYGDNFRVAPLTVLIDPIRAMQILGIEGNDHFSSTVEYIYLKQLEEAHAIVINKCDLLSAAQLERLVAALEQRYAGVRIFTVSARTGEGLDDWFDWVTTNEQPSGDAMELNYDLYAEGEALLGWLNASARVSGKRPFDGKQLMMYIAREIHTGLVSMGYEVAHLKMALRDEGREREMAVLNLVRNDFEPEIIMSNLQPLTAGYLTVNIRAEAPPEWLRSVTLAAIEKRTQTYESLSIEVENLVNFRPSRPQPTHRVPNYTSIGAS
ncbi:MAG TPA: GTP-binding protein [Thermoanaerobaculia bacterium]